MNKNMSNFPALFFILGLLSQALMSWVSKRFDAYWVFILSFVTIIIFLGCCYWEYISYFGVGFG